MNNEYVAAIVFAVWLLRGVKFDLSLLIFVYYVCFFFGVNLLPGIAFHAFQLSVELMIISLCVLLAYKNYDLAHPCFLYSLIVFSSLCIEVNNILYGVGFNSLWYELYFYRQEFSHTFDLIFAIAGSGKRGFITDAYLFILHFLRYTRNLWNKFTN